jgi:hypothetical protein
MSGRKAKERRKQALVRYACEGCGAWHLAGPDGAGLCACGQGPPHPPGWSVFFRGDATSERMLAWWDREFGGRKAMYFCPACSAVGWALAPLLAEMTPPWEQSA